MVVDYSIITAPAFNILNQLSYTTIDGRKIFQDFLRCEYSEENILFWIACEELKAERDSKNIATKARDIYEDYISILSAKEVSFPVPPHHQSLIHTIEI